MRGLRVRFTVRQIMVLVCLIALGLGLMRHVATHWGTAEFATVGPIVLITTTILAWFQKARWQAFWVGFGLCGGAYLAISVASPMAEHLPTAWLLDYFHGQYYATHPLPVEDDGFDGVVSAQEHERRFRAAGQSLISLLFALLGGVLANILFPARAELGGERLPPDGSLLKPGWRERSGSP